MTQGSSDQISYSIYFKLIGELMKGFYRTSGDEALPVIKEIMKEFNTKVALLPGGKLPPTRDFKTVAQAYIDNLREMGYGFKEVLGCSDKTARFTVDRCILGLENTSRALCEAATYGDKYRFDKLTGRETEYIIVRTRAAGDKLCEHLIRLKE